MIEFESKLLNGWDFNDKPAQQHTERSNAMTNLTDLQEVREALLHYKRVDDAVADMLLGFKATGEGDKNSLAAKALTKLDKVIEGLQKPPEDLGNS